MKKVVLGLVCGLLVIIFVGCGVKKCYTCGKSLSDGGYTAFGNDYCSHCFLYDLGLDK